MVTHIVLVYELLRGIQVWTTVGSIQTKEMCILAHEMLTFVLTMVRYTSGTVDTSKNHFLLRKMVQTLINDGLAYHPLLLGTVRHGASAS